jgi:hypothetical protein
VVLTELLVDLKERNITPAYIDMRDPMRPVYRPHNIIRINEPVIGQRVVPPPPGPVIP